MKSPSSGALRPLCVALCSARRGALRLYGVDYRHVPLMPFGPDKAELAKFNPIARVPALQLDNGEMLIDSAAILDHLDQAGGAGAIADPAAGAARRRVLTLLAVALGANEKLVDASMNGISGPAMPGTALAEHMRKQVLDGFAWLYAEFAGPWFNGSDHDPGRCHGRGILAVRARQAATLLRRT